MATYYDQETDTMRDVFTDAHDSRTREYAELAAFPFECEEHGVESYALGIPAVEQDGVHVLYLGDVSAS